MFIQVLFKHIVFQSTAYNFYILQLSTVSFIKVMCAIYFCCNLMFSIYICQQLQSLGESIGSENKGLPEELIARLPTFKYKSGFFSKKKKEE